MELIGKAPKASSSREKMEYRLRTMGCKKHVADRCTAWQLFNNNNIIIRTYNREVTVHLFGNLDHYKIKEIRYEDLTLECNNEELIKQLLG